MLNPVFFGASTRQLFGMYDPSAMGGGQGAVLCAPWGQEYLRAHQSMRHLARLLARAGVHAFRFDYTGSGDSDGSDLDDSVTQWVDDTETAIDELKDTAGVEKVSLVGLRLGGAVAALAAKGRRDVQRLVLWDPVFDGAALLEELTAKIPNAQRTFPLQLSGFRVTESAYAEVKEVGLHTFDGKLPRTLIMSTDSADSVKPLEDRLRAAKTDVVTEVRPGPQAWVEIGHFGAAGMPVGALQAIARWVTA